MKPSRIFALFYLPTTGSAQDLWKRDCGGIPGITAHVLDELASVGDLFCKLIVGAKGEVC